MLWSYDMITIIHVANFLLSDGQEIVDWCQGTLDLTFVSGMLICLYVFEAVNNEFTDASILPPPSPFPPAQA
jgi:hypothetical protein